MTRPATHTEGTMRSTRPVTTTLLLAALAAVGCSKRSQTPPTKTSSPGATQPTPAGKPDAAWSPKAFDEEGLTPKSAPALTGPVTFQDGEAAYQAKKYGDAVAIFDSYVASRPRNPWGHYMLGLSSWKNGDLAKAKQSFEQALTLDPNHVKSLVNLSRVLIDEKRHENAIDTLTRAAEIDPESVEVMRLLGRTYQAQGRTEDAVTAYRRAIALNDADAWSMNNLGLVLLDADRADEALPLFAAAVDLRRDVAAFHNNLGMALEHTGRFKAAAAAYAEALTADAGYAKAKANLARVEAVKSGPEEPFAAEGPSRVAGDPANADGDEQTARK